VQQDSALLRMAGLYTFGLTRMMMSAMDNMKLPEFQ
jgi:hypothetical protein